MSDADNPLDAKPGKVRQPERSRTLLAGNLPYLAAVILCTGAFYAGRVSTPQRDRVALVEKGALVTEALLANPQRSQADIDTQIKAPILAVLHKYAGTGYAVLDTSKDEYGGMAVVALPANAVDITAEMRAAIAAAQPQRAGVGRDATPATPRGTAR